MNKNRTPQPKKKSRMMDGTEENVSKKHRTHVLLYLVIKMLFLVRVCRYKHGWSAIFLICDVFWVLFRFASGSVPIIIFDVHTLTLSLFLSLGVYAILECICWIRACLRISLYKHIQASWCHAHSVCACFFLFVFFLNCRVPFHHKILMSIFTELEATQHYTLCHMHAHYILLPTK